MRRRGADTAPYLRQLFAILHPAASGPAAFPAPNGGDRELYEDLGHIIGCFGAALVIVITGEGEAAIVLGMELAHGATLTLAVRSPHFADLRERRYEDPGD